MPPPSLFECANADSIHNVMHSYVCFWYKTSEWWSCLHLVGADIAHCTSMCWHFLLWKHAVEMLGTANRFKPIQSASIRLFISLETMHIPSYMVYVYICQDMTVTYYTMTNGFNVGYPLFLHTHSSILPFQLLWLQGWKALTWICLTMAFKTGYLITFYVLFII